MTRFPVFALVFTLALSLPLVGQIDFVAINISPNPDYIYYADLGSPTTWTNTPVLATLTGNFIRGMELTAEKTGWYVATSALSGSPTGFYRLDDGASTLVAALPFTSTAVGGMAFSPGEDFLYWVVDPPTGEDELWRIDFDGTFTLIGPLSLMTAAGAPVTAPIISGMAIDHLTGQLYVIDTGVDTLFLVDPLTAAGAAVGTNLGVSISGIGGLDFSLDGTNRLFMASGSSIYEVNPATGMAGPLVGTLPGSTSSLAAIPGRVTLKVDSWVIGTNATITLSGGNPFDLFGLYAALGTTFLPLPGVGMVRLDLATLTELVTTNLDPLGQFVITVPLPSDPGLIGLSFPGQAYVASATSPAVRFTNLVVATIQ